MKTNITNYLIFAILVLGILGAGNLSYNEFLEEGACPKLGVIPGCYIILACFIFPFISHLFNKGKIIYFIFTGFALAVATYASIAQLFDVVECPKTEDGLPMCFVAFVIFGSLVSLKIISLKK